MVQSGLHIDRQRLRKLLREMIDIYSPSGKEEEVVSFLDDYLRKAGLNVLRLSVEEDRDNLMVLPPNGDPELVFLGHVDTVAAFDYDQYKCEESGDEMAGLGSADMKGGCAAMVEAFAAFERQIGREVPAALALVVGEEESGDGTSALLEDYSFSWALVAEPTNLVPCLSHYGYIEMELRTTCRRVHASLANQGRNAVRSMLQVLMGLTAHLEKSRRDVIYNIRDMNSSHAGFAVPDRCDVAIDLHLPPQSPVGEIAAELEDVVSRALPGGLDIRDVFDFCTLQGGYVLPDKGWLPDLLRPAYSRHGLNWSPGAFPSHSDANLLWSEGIRPVILGPGQLEKAHTQDESVSFSQVALASDLYLDLLASVPS
ncbi:MAG: M20/M25/M40 family metallo-hydrolase [Desulfatiglandales bacterium]